MTNVSLEKTIGQVSALLANAQSILVITGAGLSADSGLPTYRGIGGLYNDKHTDDGIPIEMALAGEMLATRPDITWKYLAQIEATCRGARYNRAHAVIADMEKHFPRVWVLTQNIDGFHHAAGSRNVIDIHGDMHALICTGCTWSAKVPDYSALAIPPRCPRCQAPVRPDVVFFGEMLPARKTELLYKELAKGFDVYFTIGTTSVFPYISGPIQDAHRQRKPTIEINPGLTEVSEIVDIKIALGAAEALEKIWHVYMTSRT